MKVLIFIVFILFFMLCISWSSVRAKPLENNPDLSLREVFDIYVKSVQNSDLETLFTTITKNKKFTFLTTSGRLIDSREEYYKFHEDWFKEKDWNMPVELINIHEEHHFGYTTAIFHYRQKMPDNKIHYLDSYFTLIFHKEDRMWKVVADICTSIKRSVQ